MLCYLTEVIAFRFFTKRALNITKVHRVEIKLSLVQTLHTYTQIINTYMLKYISYKTYIITHTHTFIHISLVYRIHSFYSIWT